MRARLHIDFERDLRNIILRRIATLGIRSKAIERMEISRLLAKWLEASERVVDQVPRTVHMSREIKISLIELGNSRKEQDARGMVSELCSRLEVGEDVTPWLSKKIRKNSTDQMLWQYGLHHFHLSRDIGRDGFSTRSDYLLFAHILQSDAYFVDVKPHEHPDGLRWVDQELPATMFRNWPELFAKISGVTPATVTDEEKKELWRKNVNTPLNIEGEAYVVSRHVGQTLSGLSGPLLYRADLFLREIRCIQSLLKNNHEWHDQLSRKLEHIGVDVSQGIKLELVELEGLNLSEEKRQELLQEGCVNKVLALNGLAIVERFRRVHITINAKEE